jgi:hypothetical protein
MKVEDEALLDEFRQGTCEWPGCSRSPCDPHHLFERGMGGGNRLDVRWNLMSLCREHHSMVQGQKKYLWQLCFIVLQREVWRLRRAPKENKEILQEGIDF